MNNRQNRHVAYNIWNVLKGSWYMISAQEFAQNVWNMLKQFKNRMRANPQVKRFIASKSTPTNFWKKWKNWSGNQTELVFPTHLKKISKKNVQQVTSPQQQPTVPSMWKSHCEAACLANHLKPKAKSKGKGVWGTKNAKCQESPWPPALPAARPARTPLLDLLQAAALTLANAWTDLGENEGQKAPHSAITIFIWKQNCLPKH